MHNYNKGTKYLEKGNHVKALQFLKKADGDFKEKYLNMGNCYRLMNDYGKAAECYIKANSSDTPHADGRYVPMYTLALNNLGLLEYAIGLDDNATTLYRHALTIDPLYYDALWNLSNSVLRQYFSSDVGEAKDWELGWKLYEYRFKRNIPGNKDIRTEIEQWDGVSSGNTIVVQTEQGLGDKIMFGRYLPLLKEKFARVVVQCHPSLDCLYDDYEIIRDVFEEPAAVGIPICSLAGIFGLADEKWLEGKFNARKFDKGFNIGCVWSGSSTHLNNANRSCSPSYFTGLSDLGNLYSINPGCRVPKGITDISSESWADTASTVLGLDVVVTVDTSIVHLCGTLGVPCIMIQPLVATDFRWGLGHKDNAWYASVTVIENKGWDAAFAEVRKELQCIKK